MNIAVIGSRTFDDYDLLESVLNKIKVVRPFDTIVSGGAKGADLLARKYANKHGIPIMEFLPDWDTHGKAAGFIRNYEIWKHADFGVAFWDGSSKGTFHSFEIVMKQKKTLYVIDYVKNEKFKIGV